VTALTIADVSEFQGAVDWAAYGAVNPAAIVRASYGTRHVDKQWAANVAGVRAHLRVRGYYQYIVASEDVVAQAKVFAGLVGPLQRGEFAAADVEEGAGDQSVRAALWVQTVHNLIGGEEWEYSDISFAAVHLRNFAGARYVWAAAYQRNAPLVGHLLWQYADNVRFAGIARPCDGSTFNGTIDNLAAIINPGTDLSDMAYLIRTPDQEIDLVVAGATVHLTPAQLPTYASLPVVPVGQNEGDRIRAKCAV
jgi:GH25 family lysozyme M1 (1,4-beta-N-acetylmuramidase)